MPGEQNVAAKLDRGRVLAFTSAGGAKPNAGRGGLEGFTPPHRLKARTAASDGHCAFTRAARSAGLRFAVILLPKAMDIGRDHLIHRKRSPFPYEGKDLTRSKLRRDLQCRTRNFTLREGERVCSSPHPPRSGPPSPQGEGQYTLEKGNYASIVGRFSIDY